MTHYEYISECLAAISLAKGKEIGVETCTSKNVHNPWKSLKCSNRIGPAWQQCGTCDGLMMKERCLENVKSLFEFYKVRAHLL